MPSDKKDPQPKQHADHAEAHKPEAHTPELTKPAAPAKFKAPLDCPKQGCDQMINHAGPHGPKK